MNVLEWARQNDGVNQWIETLIAALCETDPGTPIWCTWGGAIDETTSIGHAQHRWFGNDPARSVARVVPIGQRLERVPRLFTQPLCIQVVRGEQVSWIVVQDLA